MLNILNVNDWNTYIYSKKISLINEIDINNRLDNSEDNIKFNDILKNFARSNVFNMSYIAFMTLKFLETSFIPSAIILNSIDVYTDNEMYNKLFLNDTYISMNYNEKQNYFNYIKILQFILKIIIEFVVTTELSLNIQCLLITDFIDKINTNNSNGNGISNNCNDNEYFKPKIFNLFNKVNLDTIKNIKPSTRILLILKLLSKLSINNNDFNNEDLIKFIYSINEKNNNYHDKYCNNNNNNGYFYDNDDEYLNCSISNNSSDVSYSSDEENYEHNTIYDKNNLIHKNNKYLYDESGKIIKTKYININKKLYKYINNKKEINKKTKLYLDTFILDITIFFSLCNKNINTKNINTDIKIQENIYSLCSKYIINNTELIFNNFENIFDILESHLLKNINKNKQTKLYYLRNVIKNIIDIEIDNIKKLFCV